MSPRPQVSGVQELGRRWGISRQSVNAVVAAEGFPESSTVSGVRVWSDDDVAAWEAAEQAAGRALPGQTGYGPPPGTGGRPRRPKPDA